MWCEQVFWLAKAKPSATFKSWATADSCSRLCKYLKKTCILCSRRKMIWWNGCGPGATDEALILVYMLFSSLLRNMWGCFEELFFKLIFMNYFIPGLLCVDPQTFRPWRRSAQTSTFTVWRGSWRRCSRWCSTPEPNTAASRKTTLVSLFVNRKFKHDTRVFSTHHKYLIHFTIWRVIHIQDGTNKYSLHI